MRPIQHPGVIAAMRALSARLSALDGLLEAATELAWRGLRGGAEAGGWASPVRKHNWAERQRGQEEVELEATTSHEISAPKRRLHGSKGEEQVSVSRS